MEENAQRLLGTKKKGALSKALPQQQEPKTIVLKNLEGNKNKNKEDKTTVDSNSLVDEINRTALALLEEEKQNFDFESLFNYAKDHAKDSFFIELMTNPNEIVQALGRITDFKFRDSLVMFTDLLFLKLEQQAADLKSQDHNYFTNFKYLLNIMLRALVDISPNSPAYGSYLRMMQTFGRALAEDRNCSAILFLESIGLEYILEFAKKYSNKRDALVSIIMSICPPGYSNRLRLLKRIEKMVGADFRTLSGILAHMSEHQAAFDEGFEGEILDFYWSKAICLLDYPCPKMRTNGLKILSEISHFDFTKMPACYAHLRIQCADPWWEIKAQILIICANQLGLIEMYQQENTNSQ